jgi:hypothetical protein
MVANRGSTSVVLLAVQKPVCRGEEADGWAVRASIVRDAACIGKISKCRSFYGMERTGNMSSTQKPTQSCIGPFSARMRLAAVWAMTPGDTSLKMRFVMAWRRKRRTLSSSRLTASAIWA